MGDHTSHVVQTLVSEEIRRTIADAVSDGMCVSARASAARIMRTYPNSDICEDAIVAEIASAATAAGVAVADEPASQGLRHDGDATHFGVLFAQSEHLYATLDGMIARADGPIDPAQMTGELIEKNPALDLTESELGAVVRNAAKIAGRQVKQSEKWKQHKRYSKGRKTDAETFSSPPK